MDKRVEETVNRRARGSTGPSTSSTPCARRAVRSVPTRSRPSMGAPRSTIYEIVAALVKLDVLEAADAEGRVFLGRRLFLYGQAYGHHSDLPSRVSMALERLAAETQERRPSSASSTATSTRSR